MLEIHRELPGLLTQIRGMKCGFCFAWLKDGLEGPLPETLRMLYFSKCWEGSLSLCVLTKQSNEAGQLLGLEG